MPRSSIPSTPELPAVSGELIDDDRRLREVERRYNEQRELVVAQYGEGLPWHVDHYESEIRGELRRGAEAFVRAGRLLVVARDCATHGEWSGMLERLGLEQSYARRMMEAARRLASIPNRATSHDLQKVTKSQGKLIELLSLPEEQFQQLADTGETNGLHVDDVAKMTVRELREAVRNARADGAAKDHRAGVREREIERLEAERRRLQRSWDQATPAEQTLTLRTQAQCAALECRAAIMAHGDDVSSLRTRAQALLDHGRETGDDQAVFLAALFAEVERDLRVLRDELGIEQRVDADPTPDWLRAAQASGEA